MRKLDILPRGNELLLEHGFSLSYHGDYTNEIYDPHSLDIILFSWFIRGKGTHYISSNQFEIKPGSMGITPIGLSHDVVTDGPMDIINLYINPASFPLPVLPEKFMNYLQVILPMERTFFRLRENAIQIACSTPWKITGLLEQMIEEQNSCGYGRAEIGYELVKVIFMQLIREIVDHGHISLSRERFRQSERIMKVVSHLDSRFRDNYSLETLADSFGFSKSALCANFKKATGKTIFEYILMKRMERCCLQLSTTSLNVSEIAYDSGFDDISFFNKKFKAITGVSPGEYRKIN